MQHTPVAALPETARRRPLGPRSMSGPAGDEWAVHEDPDRVVRLRASFLEGGDTRGSIAAVSGLFVATAILTLPGSTAATAELLDLAGR